jgi:parallel beta-helix repeat protein
VNTTGDGGAFTSIQDAINASKDGDTVFVYSGTYYENAVVNKTINLTGENRDNTIIDGGEYQDVVKITADWINMSGFTLKNSGSAGYPDYDVGLELNNSNHCSVFNNNVSNNWFGIWLSYSLNNSIICNKVSSNERMMVYGFPIHQIKTKLQIMKLYRTLIMAFISLHQIITQYYTTMYH